MTKKFSKNAFKSEVNLKREHIVCMFENKIVNTFNVNELVSLRAIIYFYAE